MRLVPPDLRFTCCTPTARDHIAQQGSTIGAAWRLIFKYQVRDIRLFLGRLRDALLCLVDRHVGHLDIFELVLADCLYCVIVCA